MKYISIGLVLLAFISGDAYAKGKGGNGKSSKSSTTISTSASEDCSCDGKLTTLTLRYLGDGPTSIDVIQHNGDNIFSSLNLYNGAVFSLTGTDQRGKKVSNTTLGPKIFIHLGDGSTEEIHTSCSVDIEAGDTIGSFLVLSGTSRNNGLICGDYPEDPPLND